MQPPSLLSPDGQILSGPESTPWAESDARCAHASARTIAHLPECLAVALLLLTAVVLVFLGGSRSGDASGAEATTVSRLSYDDLRLAALTTPSGAWHAQRHAWLGRRVRWRGYVVARQVAGTVPIDLELPGSSLLGTDVTITWAEAPAQAIGIGQPVTFEGEIAAIYRWGSHLWIRLDNGMYIAPPHVWEITP